AARAGTGPVRRLDRRAVAWHPGQTHRLRVREAPVTHPASTRPGVADRRESMIRAAYQVMAREGVHRVPLQQIAVEAAVSKGLLIYHFSTKDGLVLATLEWVLEATEARIRRRLEEADDPAGAISNVIDE